MTETEPGPKRKSRRKIEPGNARELALVALLQVYEDQAYSNLGLDILLQKFPLPAEEKRFATALFYGTLTETPALDELIDRYSSTPLAKLDPPVRSILRQGLWQIFYSATPDSAAVNSAVILCSRFGFTSAKGLVNAVLRRAIREEADYVPKSLAAKSGFPAELARDFIEWLGSKEEVLALGQAFRETSGVSCRIRKGDVATVAKHLVDDDVEVLPASYQPQALRLKTRGKSLMSLRTWETQAILAQGEGAMLPALALAPEEGDIVADLCAAPGGKSVQLADLLNQSGLVLASDVSAKRIGLVEKTVKRLGLQNIRTATADASDPLDWPFAETPDKILLDVPCSGLGLIGSKPELKFKWNPEAIRRELIPVQRKILAKGASLLRAGGFLVYSTCTLNPEENQEVVDEFLASHKEFQRVPLTPRLPETLVRNLTDLDETLHTGLDQGMITLWPQRVRSEGFFLALLKKE